MSESSAPNFVYSRRKLQGNSIEFLSAITKRSGEVCPCGINSDGPSVAVKEHCVVSEDEHETETIRVPLMPPILCNGVEYSCPFSFGRSTQLASVSSVSESAAPNFVFGKIKPRQNPFSFSSAMEKRSGEDCLSVISSDGPSAAQKERRLVSIHVHGAALIHHPPVYKRADSPCPLSSQRSPQLPAVSTMSKSSACNFIYSRKKLRGNSASFLSEPLSLPSNLRALAHVVLRYSASIAHVSKHCSSSALFFSDMASLSSPATQNTTVQPGRIRVIKEGSKRQVGDGPVVYWMFRDQRLRDNWALIHAVDQANRSNVPVAVAFNLFDQFLGAKARQLGFMLRGLCQLQSRIEETLQIPFFLFQGEAEETIPAFLRDCGASLLVTDFSPLRQFRTCQNEICKRVSDSVTIHEVDAHNIVPIRVASEKLEYSARTLRGKINKLLPEYLIDFPMLQQPNNKWVEVTNQSVDWNNLIDNVSRKGAEVPEIKWCEPGEDAAMEVLMGSKDGFLTKRLKNYSTDRNNPLKPKGLSGLSPYLHFGQVSAQRCALEARKVRNLSPQSADAFLEELIVRRELADNFCFYQPNYDSIHGAWEWARKTLADHASDKREHIYSKEQLEKAQTADPLWNASQLEMVCHGKMHGFMRMYWAKKILEWTRGPEEALAIAIYLNDKYEIDGRDPSGYVGCMWSICGIHDQGWKERPIFGKIRYMNYAGCKRKFDVDGYIAYVKRIVGDIKKRKAENELHKTTKELLG